MDAQPSSIKPDTLLVKPAGPDCNLNCRYCFYLEKKTLFPETSRHRMNGETLEAMIRQALRWCGPAVSFAWQGGEPALMGLDFFEQAVRLQEKYGARELTGNGFQTNGLLLDKQWAKFLARRQFLTGLSLDGPRHVHDHYRRFPNGQGSWRRVHDAVRLLRDAGAPVNALSVITDYSAQFPDEIYHYFKSLGVNHMQFVPCVETDRNNPAAAAPFSVSPEQYGAFLVRLFDLWFADIHDGEAAVSIRDFDALFYTYVDLKPPGCALQQYCGTYLTVEHNGDVFPCDFFVEPQWKLGNLLETPLAELFHSPKRRDFGAQKADPLPSCAVCPWRGKCWGGCVKDRLRDPRDRGANHFCAGYRMLFEHADPPLANLAAQWRAQRRNVFPESSR